MFLLPAVVWTILCGRDMGWKFVWRFYGGVLLLGTWIFIAMALLQGRW